MSKEIVVYKENFISRIKRFFKNIFGKKEIVQESTNFEVTNNIEKTNFKEDIIVKQNEEELKEKIAIKRNKIRNKLNDLKVDYKFDYKNYNNEIERKEFMDNLSKNPELLEKFSIERLTKILQWYKNENEKRK